MYSLAYPADLITLIHLSFSSDFSDLPIVFIDILSIELNSRWSTLTASPPFSVCLSMT